VTIQTGLTAVSAMCVVVGLAVLFISALGPVINTAYRLGRSDDEIAAVIAGYKTMAKRAAAVVACGIILGVISAASN
jgi:hypothetical protein